MSVRDEHDDEGGLGGLVALFTLGCFAVLMSYGYGQSVGLRTHATRTIPVTAESDMDAPGLEVKLWKRAKPSLAKLQAEALAQVYGITSENADAYRRWW